MSSDGSGEEGKINVMQLDEKGVIKWVSTRNLYRDWRNFKVCLMVFTLIPVGAFVFFTIVGGFIDGFSLKMLALWGKVWGLVLLIVWALLLPSYYLWAWAQGGVDEWEYEMNDYGIKGRKVVHNAGRLKFLRGIAWILMLCPAKPSQKLVMRNLLYDNGKKEVKMSFAGVRSISGNEAKGEIVLKTKGSSKTIVVPRDDFAQICACIEERIPKRKRRVPSA